MMGNNSLLRGLIRSFDGATYRATILIEGSRSSYAADVPVSRGINAVEMVVGRTCVIVFFNPDDATDALVVGVN